jgi:hypothetical protein
MRVFTESSDSIKHQHTSGNRIAGVMVSELGTDKSTKYMPGTDFPGGGRYCEKPVPEDRL